MRCLQDEIFVRSRQLCLEVCCILLCEHYVCSSRCRSHHILASCIHCSFRSTEQWLPIFEVVTISYTILHVPPSFTLSVSIFCGHEMSDLSSRPLGSMDGFVIHLKLQSLIELHRKPILHLEVHRFDILWKVKSLSVSKWLKICLFMLCII